MLRPVPGVLLTFPLRALHRVLLTSLFLGACSGSTERHVVDMIGFRFQPGDLSVAVGDTIVFVNRDVVPHTATSADAGWDSGVIETGSSWTIVVRGDRTAHYICTLHPSMTGTVDVHPSADASGSR